MIDRKWQVGLLCELDPEDADRDQMLKGDDRCLLGWNKGNGATIALRLRTDDLKGFRKYESIINTLLHELTHNVFSAHDDKFFALFADLKKQYLSHHSKTGHILSEARVLDVPKAVSRSTETHLGGKRVYSADELRHVRVNKYANKK